MDVFEAIRTVLAVRRYVSKPVPAAIVARIVEAGRLTASAMNKQPWHFIVVQQRATLRELGRIVTTGRYLADAGLAIVVLLGKSSPLAGSDGSPAIPGTSLAAWSGGVGSHW